MLNLFAVIFLYKLAQIRIRMNTNSTNFIHTTYIDTSLKCMASSTDTRLSCTVYIQMYALYTVQINPLQTLI